VRGAWYFLAAIIGALACGGLFFALGSAVYAVFGGTIGERAFSWLVLGSTALGVVLGAWIGARVVRWLVAEPPP
jgi:uncharacterized membrane protein YfcA